MTEGPLVAIATRYQFRPPAMFRGEPMDTAHLDNPLAITVEWRGGGTWAVLRGPGWNPQPVWCEARDGWEYEPSPSERSDDFLERTRYPLERALEIGAELARLGPGPITPLPPRP